MWGRSRKAEDSTAGDLGPPVLPATLEERLSSLPPPRIAETPGRVQRGQLRANKRLAGDAEATGIPPKVPVGPTGADPGKSVLTRPSCPFCPFVYPLPIFFFKILELSGRLGGSVS